MDTGKTGKYLKYAIGEILLVVIGILIALSINTWNQERINAQEEKRIFRDLFEEFGYNKFLIDNGNEKMSEVTRTAERLLGQINEADSTYDEEALNMDIEKLTWVWVSGRPTTLYDVLSSSGDFKLIRSSLLRKKLADLKRNQESLIRFEEVQNRFVDDQLRPFLNRRMDRTKLLTYLEGAEIITSSHPSSFEANGTAILKSQEFANLLKDLIFFTHRITENYSRIEGDIAQMDSLIHALHPEIPAKTDIPE